MTAGAQGDRPRVVIAGTGRFGTLHARVWRDAGAQIVGLCDVDPGRLQRVASEFSVEDVSTELEPLLDSTGPDVVLVASDEASHVPLTIAALNHGCHVFVEKPLAISSSDAWQVLGAARQADRQVVVGHISRFASPYVRMRTSLQSGKIGDLCNLRLRRDFSREWFASFGDRVHPVWESCIHDIDLAVSFVGRPVRRVMAMQSSAAGSAASSVVSALLEFEGGVIATVESAWLLPRSAPQTLVGALALEGSIVGEAEAFGLDGVLRQRLLNDGLLEWTSDGVFAPDLSLWPEEDGEVRGALRREVEYAIGVFTGRRGPDMVPLEEVCWGVAAAEAVVRALRSGVPVELDQPAVQSDHA